MRESKFKTELKISRAMISRTRIGQPSNGWSAIASKIDMIIVKTRALSGITCLKVDIRV